MIEISAESGKYITQSYPTYFHRFYTQKLLSNSETVDDYMEITSELRTLIEKSDSVFEEPPKLFIDEWNEACGLFGGYNESTGFFELNGLMDITYEEAVGIYSAPVITSTSVPGIYRYYGGRTNLPPKMTGGYSNLMGSRTPYNLERLFATDNSKLEVLNLSTKDGITIADMLSTDYVIGVQGYLAPIRSKLRKIIGVLAILLAQKSSKLFFAPNLEEISISGLFHNYDLSGLPKINITSLRYLVENKYRTHPSTPTVTIHPDVYAKLTDESNVEWHLILLDALEKNITFTTI